MIFKLCKTSILESLPDHGSAAPTGPSSRRPDTARDSDSDGDRVRLSATRLTGTRSGRFAESSLLSVSVWSAWRPCISRKEDIISNAVTVEFFPESITCDLEHH